jgi:glucosamine--fructose-6-phosphate aminotransferase (isomerizing)
LNYQTPRSKKLIAAILCQGLKRLEYRGYDSAGISIDGEDGKPQVIRKQGNIACLEKAIATFNLSEAVVENHVAIAHTR